MTKDKKPTYEELEQRLDQADQVLDALRRGEVDAVLAQERPIVLRPRELERKLKESEAALVEAQALAKVGSWEYDISLDQTSWSQEMFRIFGRDPDRGAPNWAEHREYMHPEDWLRLEEALQEAMNGRTSYRGEFRVVRPDGATTWIEVIGRAREKRKDGSLTIYGTVQDITEKRKAQEVLRRTRAALLEAQATAKIGSWEYDVAMDQPSWSQEMFRIFDRDPARGEPKWMGTQEHIDPRDWERLDQAVHNAIEQGRPYREEFRIIRRDGSAIWAENIGRAQLNEAGEVIKLSGTVQDIDERKQAEQAVSESEKKYRNLYSSIRDAILVADSNRKIIDCNVAFTESFGYTLDEIRGQTSSVLYESTEEYARMGWEIQEHSKDRIFVTNINYRRKNGEVFSGETSVYYLYGEGGEVLGFVGLIRDVSGRVAAEQALQKSENRFRTAFESAPEGMALIDEQRRFVSVNKRLCEILGYSKNELLGKSFNRFTHPDDRQSGRDRWHQIIEKNFDKNRAEKRYIHKNGNIVWVQISNSAIRDEQGEVEYVLSHIYDITQRKNYQQDLIRERDLSQKYLDTAGVILLALDKQGRIEMINRQGCRVLGCKGEEAIGRDWFANYIPKDSRQRTQTIHANNMASMPELHSYVEGPVVTESGEIRLIRWFNTVIRDPEGNITGTLSSGEDITEYKAAQAAINQLAAIVNSSQDAITGKDLQGIITSWNEAAERIYGYSAEEAIGQHISLLVPEDRRDEMEQVLDAIRQDQPMRIYETMRRRKDGSLVDVSLSVSPVRDNTGQVVGAATIAHDISEIKRASEEKEKLETQLRQSQKMEAIGTLAGGIAHDFNNILAAIMGYSELVLDGLPPDSESAQNLETVITAANRAKDLTYQILSFSRQTEHRKVSLDLEPLIKEILKMLRATLPSTIEIKQNVPAGTGKVMADPVQIHQILMNLCTNAAQAMEESGGVLSIALDVVDFDDLAAKRYLDLAPGQYQRLIVGDTGVGMDKEVLERIFEPFYSTKEVGKGTGMGLSVVHGIVKNYGGEITVYSEPGQGSTFNVHLPLAEGEQKKKPPLSAGELPRGSENILFVDDEPPLVDIGKKTLSRLGYQVQGFTSAQEALEAFKDAPEDFNLLITDYTMPKMTGVQLTNEILAIKPDLPIIMCTGFSERLNSIMAQELGVARLVMKPFMPGEIARVVREVLDK